MPFNNPEQLRTGAQDARVAWRQSIRVKRKNNTLIEDNGVPTDIRVLPTELDIIPNTQLNSQLDRIADNLNQKAVSSGRRSMYFQTTPSFDASVTIGTAVEFQLDIQGLKRIQVLDIGKNQVAFLEVTNNQLMRRQQRSIRFPLTATQTGIVRYEIIAFDNFGKQILTTFRFIDVVPPRSSFATLSAQPMLLDARSTNLFITERGTTTAGWKKEGTKLVISPQYEINLDSTASFYMTSTNTPVAVTITGQYASEETFDFLTLSYKDARNSTELFKVSGKGQLNQSFTFSPQGDFVIDVKFTSDGAVSDDGVTIDSVQISPA
jgi:hypothetical protein